MADYCNTQAVTIPDVTFPEGTPRSAAFAFAADLGRCLHDLGIDINKAMAALERYESDDYADGFGQGVSVALALRDAKADLDRWQKRQAALELAASDLPDPAPKPPRNCDVGTAEQQYERWLAFCARYDTHCTGCPCGGGRSCTLAYCFAKWAQMPYEEGGAK